MNDLVEGYNKNFTADPTLKQGEFNADCFASTFGACYCFIG